MEYGFSPYAQYGGAEGAGEVWMRPQTDRTPWKRYRVSALVRPLVIGVLIAVCTFLLPFSLSRVLSADAISKVRVAEKQSVTSLTEPRVEPGMQYRAASPVAVIPGQIGSVSRFSVHRTRLVAIDPEIQHPEGD